MTGGATTVVGNFVVVITTLVLGHDQAVTTYGDATREQGDCGVVLLSEAHGADALVVLGVHYEVERLHAGDAELLALGVQDDVLAACDVCAEPVVVLVAWCADAACVVASE